MGLSRVPFVCQAPKPFLPCEMITAGKAAPDTTAVVLVPTRVNTAMLPSEQSANDVGAVGAGVGVGRPQGRPGDYPARDRRSVDCRARGAVGGRARVAGDELGARTGGPRG